MTAKRCAGCSSLSSRATASALILARCMTTSCGCRPAGTTSSTWLTRTSKSLTTRASSSLRLGDCEARMNFIKAFLLFVLMFSFLLLPGGTKSSFAANGVGKLFHLLHLRQRHRRHQELRHPVLWLYGVG